MNKRLDNAPLGKKTAYIQQYAPNLLYPVSRELGREKIGLNSTLPFTGHDTWIGYELSWLNDKGKPQIALATFVFPCSSKVIVESKSFKLYLNSFNQTHFISSDEVKNTIQKDLTSICDCPIAVALFESTPFPFGEMPGLCLDTLDIIVDQYEVKPELLQTGDECVEETVHSNLLKSNCLATGQPDWGSLAIYYKGKKIDHTSLLQYIISYRNHSGFAEHCVEQIYWDLYTLCKPDKLTVDVRYTRRGGLEINCQRSNCNHFIEQKRLIRQ